MRIMETKIIFRLSFGLAMIIYVIALAGNASCQEVKFSVLDHDPPGFVKVVGHTSTQAEKTPVLSQHSCGCGQEHVSPINTLCTQQAAVPCDSCSCDRYENCFGEKKHLSLRENVANTANFNCQMSGSYKYPVPKQYTYFWPGIYSQKRMTDYVSPYQGLEMASPKKVFNEK